MICSASGALGVFASRGTRLLSIAISGETFSNVDCVDSKPLNVVSAQTWLEPGKHGMTNAVPYMMGRSAVLTR